MPLNNKGIKGLTAADRAAWEKQNLKELGEYGYFDSNKVSDEQRWKIFKKQALLGYLNGDEEKANQLKTKSNEYIDSLLKTPATKDNIVTTQKGVKYKDTKEIVGKHKTSSIDLLDDSVDMTELNIKGVNYGQAAQSIKQDFNTNELLNQRTAELEASYNQILSTDETYKKKALNNLKKIAENISPDYIRYRKTNKLNQTPESFWIKQAAKYQTLVDSGNLQEANRQLSIAIQDEIYRNQGGWERTGNWLAGTADSALGVMADATAVVGGILSLPVLVGVNALDKDRKTSLLTATLDDIVDNPITRWGDSVTKYGLAQYWDEEAQKDMEESGIGRYAITKGSRNAAGAQLLELMQQYGFTAGSMLAGAGEAKLANWLFKGIRAAKVSGKTGEALAAMRPILSKLKKAEDWVQRWLIPALVGTAEGAEEGLQTKEEVRKKGYQELNKAQQKEVEKELQQVLSNLSFTTDKETGKMTYYDPNGNPVNIKDLYDTIWERHLSDGRYKEVEDQIEYAAATAATDNFLFNSAINGFINSTFQSSQFSQDVKSKMTRSRLGRFLGGERELQLSGRLGTEEAKAAFKDLTPTQKVFALLREPWSEAMEEGKQTLSNAFTSGAASNSIQTFIDNKYSGDGHMKVGDSLFWDNLAAGWAAMGEPIQNGELAYSMFAGAFTSIAGGIHTISRGHKGPKLDANGNVMRDSNGKIQYERTFFERGYNADGSLESYWDVAKRMTPWRSGLFTNYMSARGEDGIYKRRAEMITDWLRNPENVEKFNGLAGTQQWLEQMSKSAKTMNEFNYRSEQKGKFINDVMMLELLNGTEQYQALYDNLSNMAMLDTNDKNAVANVANAYRQSAQDDSDTRSDEEIASQVKKNSEDILKTMNQVKEKYNEIDGIFGNIDPEAKKAIAFNMVMGDDLKERKQQLKDEVDKMTSSIESTQPNDAHKVSLDSTGKRVIATYGSIANTKKAIENKQKEIEKLDSKIEFLEKQVNRTEQQNNQLQTFKRQKENLNNGFREIEDWYNNTVMATDEQGNTTQAITDADIALNEKEIMALPSAERSNMLARGMGRRYNVKHSGEENPGPMKGDESPYSPEQQKYIENIISTLGQDNVEKIIDSGFIDAAIQANEETFNAILSDQEALLSFINQSKANAQARYAREKYSYIGRATTYEDFVKGMKTLIREGSQLEQSETIRDLARREDEYYERYKKTAKKLHDIAHFVIRANGDEINDNTDLFALSSISDYLLSEGIDEFSTDDEIINKLYEVGENGVTGKLVDFAREANKKYGLDIDEQKIIKMASMFRNAVLNYGKNSTVAVEVATPAVEAVNTNSSAVITPAVTVDTEGVEEATESPSPEGHLVVGEEPTNGTPKGETTEPTAEATNGLSPFEQAYNAIAIAKFKQAAIPIARRYSTLTRDSSLVDDVSEYLNKIDTTNMTLEDFVKRLKADIAINEDEGQPNLTGMANTVIKSLIDTIEGANDGEAILEEARKEAKAKIATTTVERKLSPAANNTEPTVAGGLYWELENPLAGNKYSVGNPIRNYFSMYDMDDYISDTRLPVKSRGGSDVLFYYDKDLDDQLKEFLKDKYPVGEFPVIAMYKIDKKDASKNGGKYNAKEINGEFYIPIGIVPSGDSKFGNTANAIRSKLLNTDSSQFIQNNGRPLSASNRISAPSMTHGNTKENDKNLNDIVNERVREEVTEEELNKINNPEISQEEQKEVRKKRDRSVSKVLATIANRLHIVDANKDHPEKGKHEVLAYQLATGKKDMGADDMYIFIKEMEEVTNFRNQSLQDVYNSGQTLEDFNEYFKLCKDRITKTLQQAYKDSEEGKATTIVQADGFRYIHNNITDFFRSSLSPQFNIKVNKNNEFAIYLGDEELAEFKFDDNGNLQLDFKQFFDNLIFPNGQLRQNMNFQVSLQGIIDQANKGDYNLLFERAYKANLLRTPMTSLDRPARVIELTRPQGLDTAAPKKLADMTLGSDLSGTNNTDDRIITTSGERVNRDTGMTNTGNIPSNPVTDKKKQSDSILLKVAADGRARDKARHSARGLRSLYGDYVGVTALIAEERFDPNSPYAIPSSNIGTTVDTLVRDFFVSFNLNRATKDDEGTPLKFTKESIDKYFEKYVDEESGEEYLRNKRTGTVYYNFSYNEMRNFLENSMLKLADYFESRHLTIYPENMGTVGKVTLSNGDIKTVVGEFDLLAQDENGDIHIFDMKTHAWDYNREARNPEKYANALQENSDKWSKQLGYYKELFEAQYLQGTNIKVVECGIIPIKVSYPNPNSNKYISDDVENGRSSWDDNATHRLYIESTEPRTRGQRVDVTEGKLSLDLNDNSDPSNPKFVPIYPCTEDMIDPNRNTEGFFDDKAAQQLGANNGNEIVIQPLNPVTHSEGDPVGSRDIQAGSLPSDTNKLSWDSLDDETKSLFMDDWDMSENESREKFENIPTLEEQQNAIQCPHSYK